MLGPDSMEQRAVSRMEKEGGPMNGVVGIILLVVLLAAVVGWWRRRHEMPLGGELDSDEMDEASDEDDPEAREGDPDRWTSRAPRWAQDGMNDVPPPPPPPMGGDIPGDA